MVRVVESSYSRSKDPLYVTSTDRPMSTALTAPGE